MNKTNTRLIKKIEVMQRHIQAERLIHLLESQHQELMTFPQRVPTILEKIRWTLYYLQGYLYENDYDVLKNLFQIYSHLLAYIQTEEDCQYRLCISRLREQLKEEFIHVYGFH